MIFFKRFLNYGIFCSALLLAFFLVFEQYLVLPGFVAWIGRWHPMVLHFPVVLIMVAIIQFWRKDAYFEWYLSITTFLTFITAISGFLLSLEGGIKGNLILTHQWMGVAVSYVMGIWYWLNQQKQPKIISSILIQGALIILITLTGHFGGMVTHGIDFLAFSDEKTESPAALPDNPNIFTHIIQPILHEKCVSCHNPNKSKGELMLVDFSSFMAGGKSGLIVDQENFENSGLLKRISLPLEDEDHMPPKGEKQLTEDEMILLAEWVKSGAGEHMQFGDLEMNGRSFELVQKLIQNSRNDRWNGLPDVSNNKIVQLSSNYIRIRRLFDKSNALEVIVYPHNGYQNADIKNLNPIAGNITELNLSGLPIDGQVLGFVGTCENLEKLNLSSTTIEDDSFIKIKKLNKLQDIRIYNTGVGDDALIYISELSGLKSLFVYNTGISEDGLSNYRKENSDVYVIKTAEEAKDFKSVLPAPTVAPGTYFFSENIKIKLMHPLSGIDLFYTMDGSIPDKTSDIATDSLEIVKSTQLIFYAAKEGWESSKVDSARFFRTTGRPDHFALTYKPDPKYAGSGEKLLFDLDKGPDNFGDSAWMAFREGNFILNCEWIEPFELGSVIISSIVQTDPYLFPPESIVVRGGMEKSGMKELGRLNPVKLEERSERYFDFYECHFNPANVRFIEIIVQPLQRIPMWHPGKGQRGWFFIDEVVFEGG